LGKVAVNLLSMPPRNGNRSMGIGPWEWDGNGNSHRIWNGNEREWELIAWEWEGMCR